MHFYTKDELIFLFCALFNCIPGLLYYCITSRKSRKALTTTRGSQGPLPKPLADIEAQTLETTAEQQS